MSNEELNAMIMKAEDNYEALKDRVHEQYEEIKRLNNNLNKLEEHIERMIEMYKTSYSKDCIAKIELEQWEIFKNRVREIRGNEREI